MDLHVRDCLVEGYEELIEGKKFTTGKDWETFLKKQKIETECDCRIATEAALVGGTIKIGLDLNFLPIISDAAPQFALFLNGLCWAHEERHYRKLIPKVLKKIASNYKTNNLTAIVNDKGGVITVGHGKIVR